MKLFFDADIGVYEDELNFAAAIEYMEKIFNSIQRDDLIATLVGTSWYYLVEGDVNQSPKDYKWEYFLSKWKQYIDIGLELYPDSERFCYIAGYTLSLHGIYINSEYEKKGLQLMSHCEEVAISPAIKRLAQIFIEKSKRKKVTLSAQEKEIIQELFPSESMLDNYFKQIVNGY